MVTAGSAKRLSSASQYSAPGEADLLMPSATSGSLVCAGLTFPRTILFHNKNSVYYILKVWESRKKHKNLHIYSSFYLRTFEALFKYYHLSVESKCHFHLILRDYIT